MGEPELPQPGGDLDYADPACPLTSSEVLVITAAEAAVQREFIRWCSLDTDDD